ncbi:uncharacterized protein LOC112556644 isoform X1 [Pomacea canaliculata]|uniref:uncharacterized protein LOC112556644 isoform X1 n=1 Tax=Pomacea canaliculata TaxID=400727 RepID=UPI000D738C12|nr:uncharacterized protein LOC112556644 isoform X1 [Pomacea canaliculata]XP_025081617.1 uncharacterized protein LOC112556644 isoform X1 [Pomacea canaliculata]XP_025081618.1 uncharacterized protein LOC112556644 isoform X1 [Pomacea canaliculata]XP_025081619.1 uncharacterized protein LOC112556644 isoform X1 [Pomacea canaliculata]XP_025081620.1 uncharacterized protein LOC112556644 isoform X1 [Pomacea canaliculata]
MPFTSRSKLYILGYAGVVLATVAGSVGLGAPGWFIIRRDPIEIFFGLWQACARSYGHFECTYIDYTSFDQFMKKIQSAACIGVALLIVSTLYGLFVNMSSTDLPSSPIVETTALLGGISLLSGCIMWVFYRNLFSAELLSDIVSFGYAMIIATIGSVLALLASACVAVASRRAGSYQILS